MTADAELRVVLAGAAGGVDPGRLARRHGCAALLRAAPGALERMGALPALVNALRIAGETDLGVYRHDLAERGISCLTLSDPGYPDRLRELHDPPLAMFTCGTRADALRWQRPSVAVVGARRASEAGLRLAERLAGAVAEAGGLVVSGLARGIDAAAHEGALEASGVTLAVLGCGVDVAYPRSNRHIYDRIRARGLLVSEYPPGTPPAPWRFPARNRLIAALAGATLVVEARARSGALITADHALDIGRDVLAVPGAPGFTSSAGTNGLLKSGAGLIEDAADLCSWLGLDPPQPHEPQQLNGDDRRLAAALAEAPAAVDELARRVGLPVARVGAAIGRLELAGAAAQDEHGRWRPG
jgi:DNA processing protein